MEATTVMMAIVVVGKLWVALCDACENNTTSGGSSDGYIDSDGGDGNSHDGINFGEDTGGRFVELPALKLVVVVAVMIMVIIDSLNGGGHRVETLVVVQERILSCKKSIKVLK